MRAFHRFTLVDQQQSGRDITKGRHREQGAVKISCARQDPNARNCHGYRKFVRRSVLEQANGGYLVDDTIVIRYEIDLVVTSGGALNKSTKQMQPFTIDLQKQTKIGDHLVKLLPPAQSFKKRAKRELAMRLKQNELLEQAKNMVEKNNNRFQSENIDDSEAEDDAGDEDQLAIGHPENNNNNNTNTRSDLKINEQDE